jgi:hypothetical protein
MYIRYFCNLIFCAIFSINASYSGVSSKLFCCCFGKKNHSNETYENHLPKYAFTESKKDLPVGYTPAPYRSAEQEHVYKTSKRVVDTTQKILEITTEPKYKWVKLMEESLKEHIQLASWIIENLENFPPQSEKVGDKKLLETIKPLETLANNLEEVLRIPNDICDSNIMAIVLQAAYSRPEQKKHEENRQHVSSQ